MIIKFTSMLSESRAKTAKLHLIDHGIASDRITTEGRNCQNMLYPLTSSEKLQSLNRRIEIVVVGVE